MREHLKVLRVMFGFGVGGIERVGEAHTLERRLGHAADMRR